MVAGRRRRGAAERAAPAWLRWYARSDAAVEGAVEVLRGLQDGLWLGLLDERRLAVVDQAYYDGQPMYTDDAHNTRGLYSWEVEAVEGHFPPGARVVVTGAGGGREVLALAERGFDVTGYEPNAALATAGTALLARRGWSARVEVSARTGWPGRGQRVDAVVLGWGSYMLIPSRQERIALLRAASEATGGEGPVLLSYFEMGRSTLKHRVAARVARPLRRVRRVAPLVVGDALEPNFVHFFSAKQVVEEMAGAGLDVVVQGTGDYGWAIGRGRGPRGGGHGG